MELSYIMKKLNVLPQKVNAESNNVLRELTVTEIQNVSGGRVSWHVGGTIHFSVHRK